MQNVTKRDIASIETQQYRAVNPYSALPFKVPARFTKKPRIRRHALHIAVCQVIYAIAALASGGAAYYCLASQPIYRIVALVVIGILWSNAASIAARRKPLDIMATMEHPALKAWDKRLKKKQRKPLYTEKTEVYLKAIKSSFV